MFILVAVGQSQALVLQTTIRRFICIISRLFVVLPIQLCPGVIYKICFVYHFQMTEQRKQKQRIGLLNSTSAYLQNLQMNLPPQSARDRSAGTTTANLASVECAHRAGGGGGRQRSPAAGTRAPSSGNIENTNVTRSCKLC